MRAGRQSMRRITATLCLLSIANCGHAATSDEKSAAAVDEVFSDLTKAGSPGCALAVYREGKIIYSNGYGLANVEDNVLITAPSAFDIRSTSKQVTPPSILLLVKQNTLS